MCGKFKLLLSFRWYSVRDPLLEFSGYSRFLLNISGYSGSLTDASGYLISVEFSKILKSVKSSRFLRYRVDISKNLNRFPKFRFEVKVIHYKTFLLIIGGGK